MIKIGYNNNNKKHSKRKYKEQNKHSQYEDKVQKKTKKKNLLTKRINKVQIKMLRRAQHKDQKHKGILQVKYWT